MNSNVQFDSHPDAESLNAFAEQALAERERGEILAHLAGCSRCRQVVYLAQEAAAVMEPAAAAPAARPAARHQSWFRSWWLVLTPAAALAAVLALAFFIHLRRQQMGPEMAKVVPQSAPQNEAGNSEPVEQPPRVQVTPASEKTVPAPAAPARPVPKKMKAAPPGMEPRQVAFSAPASMPSAAEADQPLLAAANEPAVPPGTSGSAHPSLDAVAESKSAAPVATLQEERMRAVAASQSRTMAEKEMSPASAKKAAKREPAAGVLTAAAPPPQFDANSASSRGYNAGELHGAGGAFAVYKAKQPALPSGLPAVSTVTARNRTLALDGSGSVFLSEDSESRWESVAKQWTGRAVAVRVQPAPGANDGATPATPAIFEIVNDQGQIWISTDGRIWKAK